MALVQTQIYSELARELAGIPARHRGANGKTQREEIYEHYRRVYGVRPNTFRRWQRTQQPPTRKDAGHCRKADHWRPIIEPVFRIQCEYSDFELPRWAPSEIAVREARRRGLLNGTALTERNYNLWVQKLGLKKERGFTRFQAEYSNQVHQFDVTGSPYLEVIKPLGDGDFMLQRRTPRSRLSKGQKEEGLRLWIAAVVDDYSGVKAAQYVVARGESAAWIRLFLDRAWRGLDADLPLRGLPEVIYCDNGQFTRAKETTPYLSQEMGVGVELRMHEPYRARSTGKVERSWQSLKRSFETGFLSSQDYWTLADVNRMVIQWCVQEAEAKHRWLELTKARAYVEGMRGPARIPADDALRNAFRTYERVVDGSGLIRLDREIYRVSSELRSQRVLVYRNGQGEIVAEDVLTGQRSAAEVWNGPLPYGDFESFAETERERVAKRREKGDWGEGVHPYSERMKDEGGRLNPTEWRTRLAVRATPSRKETAKSTPFSEANQFITGIDARIWVARELGISLLRLQKEYPHRWDELNELLTRTLEREEIAAWVSGVHAAWGDIKESGGAV